MKKISSYMIKYWYAYAFGILSMIISISLDMISPQLTKHIIDDVVLGGNMNILSKLLLGILAVGIGRAIFQYSKEYTFDRISSKIASEIRRNLFNHIQSLSTHFFDKTNTGELMARVKDDVDRIWNALGFVGMLIIEVIIHTALVLFSMSIISPKLTIIPAITIPIVGLFALLMERKLGKVYEEISEENAVLNTVAEENLAGVRTVKAFARESHEVKKFLSHNKRYYELNMKQSKVFVRYYPYFQFVTKLLPITIILLGGYMVINNQMTLGELGAFTAYSMNIVWPMEMLGWLTNEFSSALASNKKLKDIYSEQPIIKEVDNPIVLGDLKGSIDFSNVFFQRDNKQNILQNVNFHVDAGKTIGIMGATGAGKTSIINLLQRMYDVSEGEIRIDDVNIKNLTLKQLRGNISIVMQNIFLFSDTIEENIKLGKRDTVDRKVIEQAVQEAQAKSFIDRMENQYDTIIGERGVGLSGGQKQRISIARALAKKSPILVLDDSTSALDMETEHMIQECLRELNHTTKIIIAHRISAVRNAHEIIFLENGSISERGTHESLLKQKGLYYKTYTAQYGDYLNDTANSTILKEV
jgi:ATP-binding cassette, subfamily B, multidrug efflux pump